VNAGFLIIYAKFSDILGRKFMILVALAIFFAFSIGCGFATSMLQLLVSLLPEASEC
jgi:MFS family permease